MQFTNRSKRLAGVLSLTLSLTFTGLAQSDKKAPLSIEDQGSFAVGGTVVTHPGTFNPKQPTPEGQTLHGDHAFVFYQIPAKRRSLPLVFLHGTGQFAKTWETTRTVVKAFKQFFFAAASLFICSISRAAAMQAVPRCRQP